MNIPATNGSIPKDFYQRETNIPRWANKFPYLNGGLFSGMLECCSTYESGHRGERGRKSDIRLTNFPGIELRDFLAEIAHLALIIAEFQCDELYLGHKQALTEFLPLESENWITCGDALRLDWLTICPPTSKVVKYHHGDLFDSSPDWLEIDFENEGGDMSIRHGRFDPERRHLQLEIEISRVYEANFRVYGAPKVWRRMSRKGIKVARCAVERLMKRLNLKGIRRGAKRRTFKNHFFAARCCMLFVKRYRLFKHLSSKVNLTLL